MSKTLRRPMFRGGRVDSRGTGITSGLMDDSGYADGGRVGFQRGGYSTIPGIDDLSQVGIYNPYRSLSSFAGPGPQNITPRQRLGLSPVQTIPSYYTGTARQQIKQREEDLRTQAQAEQEDAASAAFAKAFVPTETGTGTGTEIGTGTRKGGIDLLSDEEDITRQAKLYQKLLGGDEAKSQAVYDALLAASPAFFKGKNLREAAPEVLTAINKSGAFDKPRDIKQASAQLAIQRAMLKDKAVAEERARLGQIQIASEAKRDPIAKQLKDLTGNPSIAGTITPDKISSYVQASPVGTQFKVLNPITKQEQYIRIITQKNIQGKDIKTYEEIPL
jgi:hypothetical protein